MKTIERYIKTINTAEWACLISCFTLVTAGAAEEAAGSSDSDQQNTFGSDPRDPSNFIQDIERRRAQRDSLFPSVSTEVGSRHLESRKGLTV